MDFSLMLMPVATTVAARLSDVSLKVCFNYAQPQLTASTACNEGAGDIFGIDYDMEPMKVMIGTGGGTERLEAKIEEPIDPP